MFPSGRDYPHIRPNGMMPFGPPPINIPWNTSMNIIPRPFDPPPMQGRPYVTHPLHGGLSAYPPPPPTPVPRPYPFQFMTPQQAFVPSVSYSPVVDTLPLPPSTAPSPPPLCDRKPNVDILNPESDVASTLISSQLPSDPEILKNIEGMVEFVVRNGPRYESIVRAKHAGDPKFAFLFENDSDPEAVINRAFYKWKKQRLQLQLQTEADKRINKHANHELNTRWTEKERQIIGKDEELPGSPVISDMDMDDDLMSPSPKKESSEHLMEATLESASENISEDELSRMRFPSQEKIAGFSDFSHGEEERHKKELQGNTLVLAGDKQAQCHLAGNITGRVIDNYLCDTTDASDDSELSQNLDLDVGGRFNQEKLGKDANGAKMIGKDGNINLEAEHGVEYVLSRGLKRLDGPRAGEPQRDFEEMGLLKKDASEKSRKRGRSRTRSEYNSRTKSSSRSRSSSRTGSKRTNRSRSRSQSMEDSVSVKLDVSLSSEAASINGMHRSISLMSPRDLQDGLKKGVKRNGPIICINHARGRCFRGNSCRFYHQDSPDNQFSGSDTTHELSTGQPDTCTEVRETTPIEELETYEPPDMPTVCHNSEGKVVQDALNNIEVKAETTVEQRMKIDTHIEKSEADSKVTRLGCNPTVLPLEDKSTMAKSPTVVDISIQPSSIGAALADDGTSASPFHPRSSGTQLSQLSLSMHRNAQKQYRIESTMGQIVSCQHTPSGSGSYSFHQSSSFQPPESSSNLSPFSHATPLEPLRNHHANTGQDGDGQNLKISKPLVNQIQDQPHGLTTGDILKPYNFHGQDSPASIVSTSQAGLSIHGFPNIPKNDLSQMTGNQAVLVSSSVQHDFSPAFPMTAHSSQSSYVSSCQRNISRGFTFSNGLNHTPDGYANSCYKNSEGTTSWSLPWSSGVLSELAAAGVSSPYSYTLTTIPPLSSLIQLPGAKTEPSPSGDQYDPLSDSIKTSVTDGLNSMSYSFRKMSNDGRTVGGLENSSPGPENTDSANAVEADGDPVVGIVENVSPPDDNNRIWSPGETAEGAEDGHTLGHSKTKMSNSRGLKLLRAAVASYVKEVLKPTWREGRMSKDAFKNIVKKTVDKVTVALPSHHIPKSQEKVDQFMMSSRSKISKLVQGYIDKYQKA